MKRAVLLLLIGLIYFPSFSQNSASIVKWTYAVKEEDGKKLLLLQAEIKKGWHLYSQFLDGDGPIPTTFTFEENKNYTLVGKVTEQNVKTAFDPNFDMQINYFEGTTVFTQEIKNNTSSSVVLKGNIEFMVCDDTMCYPPETVPFTIELP